MKHFSLLFLSAILITGCSHPVDYDIIIRNGLIYDGTGSAAQHLDIGIIGEKIDTLGDLSSSKAKTEIDATGMAVAPGFINMLSWAGYPLLKDGRSMSGIKQGVTLEIFGEGSSFGPINPEVQKTRDTPWLSFGEGMVHLENSGISPNVASFVGATTIRTHQLGGANRAPSKQELQNMEDLVRESMEEGALGVGSSLIYAPAFYAKTDELIALAKAAGEYDGMYTSHIRSEGDNFLEAFDEFLTISVEAGVDAEIYHLKAAGERNWNKLDKVIHKIDSLRAQGHHISTNMYTYTAASTGLDATMPPWVQEGSTKEFLARLQQPEIREKVLEEMNSSTNDWENFLQLAGNPENILLLEFTPDSLKKYVGKNLGEIAAERHSTPAETILDLMVANGGDIGSVYFLRSEGNVRKEIRLPYMAFGSDARSIAAEGENLESSTHPRTYGNFARLLGKYVREEHIIPLEEAIYRLTWMPAQRIKIKERGKLAPGFFADIVIFDPKTINDKATFTEPHQYAVGMKDVFVNGTQVLKDGTHTGAMPGKFVRGPGYTEEE